MEETAVSRTEEMTATMMEDKIDLAFGGWIRAGT